MAFISDPVSSIATAIGNLFQLGEDLSPAFNAWIEMIAIPQLERDNFESRLRRSKWRLKHYPKLQVLTEVAIRFDDKDATMQATIGAFLKAEINR